MKPWTKKKQQTNALMMKMIISSREIRVVVVFSAELVTIKPL